MLSYVYNILYGLGEGGADADESFPGIWRSSLPELADARPDISSGSSDCVTHCIMYSHLKHTSMKLSYVLNCYKVKECNTTYCNIHVSHKQVCSSHMWNFVSFGSLGFFVVIVIVIVWFHEATEYQRDSSLHCSLGVLLSVYSSWFTDINTQARL